MHANIKDFCSTIYHNGKYVKILGTYVEPDGATKVIGFELEDEELKGVVFDFEPTVDGEVEEDEQLEFDFEFEDDEPSKPTDTEGDGWPEEPEEKWIPITELEYNIYEAILIHEHMMEVFISHYFGNVGCPISPGSETVDEFKRMNPDDIISCGYVGDDNCESIEYMRCKPNQNFYQINEATKQALDGVLASIYNGKGNRTVN